MSTIQSNIYNKKGKKLNKEGNIYNNKAKLPQSLSGQQMLLRIEEVTVDIASIPLADHQQQLSCVDKLVELNQMCIQHLIQIIQQKLSQTQLPYQSSNISSKSSHISLKPQPLSYKSQQTSQKQQQQLQQKQFILCQTITPKNNSKISLTDYQILQKAVQKAQQQVRKHIGIQHQMKICLQQLQQQLYETALKSQSVQTQLTFLKKQLSITKRNQLELKNKLKSLEQQLTQHEYQLKNNKLNRNKHKTQTKNQSQLKNSTELPSNKTNTLPSSKNKPITQPFNRNKLTTQQPQSNKLFDNPSNKSLQKSFQSNAQQPTHSNKRHMTGKILTKSKLGSRKQSKLFMNNGTDIGLESFITLSMHKKKEQLQQSKNGNGSTKEMFWNKRLKKKDSCTVQGLYSDITLHGLYSNATGLHSGNITQHHSINRSLNISPRQLKKNLRQKQLKNTYSINPSKKANNIYSVINEETVLKRKEKQIRHSTYYQPASQISYQLAKKQKVDSIGKSQDRSKSIAY